MKDGYKLFELDARFKIFNWKEKRMRDCRILMAHDCTTKQFTKMAL